MGLVTHGVGAGKAFRAGRKFAPNAQKVVEAVEQFSQANQARLKMVALAYNLLHMLRAFHLKGEDVKRSMEWLILRAIKTASRISYHGRRWWVHVASSLPLAHHYRDVLSTG